MNVPKMWEIFSTYLGQKPIKLPLYCSFSCERRWIQIDWKAFSSGCSKGVDFFERQKDRCWIVCLFIVGFISREWRYGCKKEQSWHLVIDMRKNDELWQKNVNKNVSSAFKLFDWTWICNWRNWLVYFAAEGRYIFIVASWYD